MATPVQFEVKISDVPYQQVAGTPLLARVYRPSGPGPFPTIVDVHGGAWNNGDRTNDTILNQALAAQGILTVAIDFRQPPEAGYPASVQDMNLAIRWLKVHAAEFGGTDRVGALGVSSGGHLVLLAGLRPRDARYAALPLEGHPDVDASLAYVVACWPVSDPLYRYQVARQAGNEQIVKAHDAYWGTEDAMAEGSPPLILERGEPVELQPGLAHLRAQDRQANDLARRKVGAGRAAEGVRSVDAGRLDAAGDLVLVEGLVLVHEMSPRRPATSCAVQLCCERISR